MPSLVAGGAVPELAEQRGITQTGFAVAVQVDAIAFRCGEIAVEDQAERFRIGHADFSVAVDVAGQVTNTQLERTFTTGGTGDG